MDDVYKILVENRGIGAYMTLKSKNLLTKVTVATSFLNQYYDGIGWSQRFWHIKNKVINIVRCKNEKCNNVAKWDKYACIYVSCSAGCKNELIREITKRNFEIDGVNITKKAKATNIKKYGVGDYKKTDDFKKKTKATNIKKYGVELYVESEESKTAKADRDKKEFLKQLPGEYTLLSYSHPLKLKHHTCNKEFEIKRYLYALRKRFNREYCMHCNPLNHKSVSKGEKEVFEFIKSVNSSAVPNDRTIIKPKEIDILILNLNIGFEFNETNYHADPRKYKGNDYLSKVHRLAKEQWKRDELKIKLCEEKGITLITIWQIDWKNNKEFEKQRIINLINNKFI